MKNKPLFIFILFLSFLATLLVVCKLFFVKKTGTLPVLPTPTPYGGLGDKDIQQEIQRKDQEDFPLLHFIPYQTPNWSIDYFGPLTLEVVLKKDTAANRKEVLGWITSHGVNPLTHKISWKVAL